MKFSIPVHAPEGPSEGLTSYVKRPRIRPVQIAINLVEAFFGLLGVVLIILALRYGSFEKAGTALDHALACVSQGISAAAAHLHGGGQK